MLSLGLRCVPLAVLGCLLLSSWSRSETGYFYAETDAENVSYWCSSSDAESYPQTLELKCPSNTCINVINKVASISEINCSALVKHPGTNEAVTSLDGSNCSGTLSNGSGDVCTETVQIHNDLKDSNITYVAITYTCEAGMNGRGNCRITTTGSTPNSSTTPSPSSSNASTSPPSISNTSSSSSQSTTTTPKTATTRITTLSTLATSTTATTTTSTATTPTQTTATSSPLLSSLSSSTNTTDDGNENSTEDGTKDAANNNKSDGLDLYLVVGTATCGAVLAVLVVVVIITLCYRRRNSKENKDTTGENSEESHAIPLSVAPTKPNLLDPTKIRPSCNDYSEIEFLDDEQKSTQPSHPNGLKSFLLKETTNGVVNDKGQKKQSHGGNPVQIKDNRGMTRMDGSSGLGHNAEDKNSERVLPKGLGGKLAGLAAEKGGALQVLRTNEGMKDTKVNGAGDDAATPDIGRTKPNTTEDKNFYFVLEPDPDHPQDYFPEICQDQKLSENQHPQIAGSGMSTFQHAGAINDESNPYYSEIKEVDEMPPVHENRGFAEGPSPAARQDNYEVVDMEPEAGGFTSSRTVAEPLKLSSKPKPKPKPKPQAGNKDVGRNDGKEDDELVMIDNVAYQSADEVFKTPGDLSASNDECVMIDNEAYQSADDLFGRNDNGKLSDDIDDECVMIDNVIYQSADDLCGRSDAIKLPDVTNDECLMIDNVAYFSAGDIDV